MKKLDEKVAVPSLALPMRFSNKFVVITGAAGGIGSAIARRFLSEGAKVCAVDNRADALNQLVLDLDAPKALLAIKADVSSEESWETLSSKLQQTWGTVDILINVAHHPPQITSKFKQIDFCRSGAWALFDCDHN